MSKTRIAGPLLRGRKVRAKWCPAVSAAAARRPLGGGSSREPARSSAGLARATTFFPSTCTTTHQRGARCSRRARLGGGWFTPTGRGSVTPLFASRSGSLAEHAPTCFGTLRDSPIPDVGNATGRLDDSGASQQRCCQIAGPLIAASHPIAGSFATFSRVH